MRWTKEDAADVEHVIDQVRALDAALRGDLGQERARPSTRKAIDAVLESLLALDDVYFEGDDGNPLPEVWRRARLTVGKR